MLLEIPKADINNKNKLGLYRYKNYKGENSMFAFIMHLQIEYGILHWIHPER